MKVPKMIRKSIQFGQDEFQSHATFWVLKGLIRLFIL